MKRGISTAGRYLYLNLYAILLFVLGCAAVVVPLWRISLWFLAIQIPLCLLFLSGMVSILKSWDDKKRKYELLMERNKSELRPDTFKEFMEAPCGRLLVKIVLKDLRQEGVYSELKQYREPFYKYVAKECSAKGKTYVYINEEFKDNNIV